MYSHSSWIKALQLVTHKVKLSTDECTAVVVSYLGPSSHKFRPSLRYTCLKMQDEPLGWA